MRITPNVTLRDDQSKKDYPPGVEADVSDTIAIDAIARGLAVEADPGATAAVDPDDEPDDDEHEDDEPDDDEAA